VRSVIRFLNTTDERPAEIHKLQISRLAISICFFT